MIDNIRPKIDQVQRANAHQHESPESDDEAIPKSADIELPVDVAHSGQASDSGSD